MPGDISILKFNNILHWQTPSCLRPTLNRRYFTLLISFSSTAASQVVGLGFHLHKFNSPQSLQLWLLVVTTLQFWSSLCQDCCFLECPVKPAQRDVEFGWFSLLCALHTGQCDGDSATLSRSRQGSAPPPRVSGCRFTEKSRALPKTNAGKPEF